MAEYSLLSDSGHVDLGDGYVLQTNPRPGMVRAEAPGASRDLTSDPFEAALTNSGLRLEKTIVLPPEPVAAEGTRGLAAGPGTPAGAVLDVDVGEDQSCVLLVEDLASGSLSWVTPESDSNSLQTRALRKRSTTLRFRIPPARSIPTEGARGILDTLTQVGQKISSFVFKITDDLLGPIVHGFAKKWEVKHRPTFVRTFGPDDYQTDDPNFPRLDEAGWRRLAQGRALLFVHGTFSTRGTFAPLPNAGVAELSRRYGGRMFAFNHATLTSDPRENAIAFLSAIPQPATLEIDIVCHSRGGLVAREIAALGQAQGSVAVRNIVFVGATNAGTALADAAHMVQMIDRFTTIAKFIPSGTARKIVDALVLVVKILGHALLDDLEGLAAMNPTGGFMKALNIPGGTPSDFFAIASDFEPKPGTPFLSLTRAEDFTVDRVFESVANDLVVPRDGVFAMNGAGGFPIGDARCLLFGPADGVIHTEFFSEPRTATKLLDWLNPGAPASRGLTSGPSIEELARVLDAFRDQALAALSARDAGARALAADATFTPGDLEALRPHVVSLREGLFAHSGVFSTTPGDVDAIIREHIPSWAKTQPTNQPLRVVIWAHGGLVGESQGLQIARKHVDWWKSNGAYPIYFVWETGLFDALRSILESVARKLPGLATRDLFDFTTDPLVQEGVRALGGVHVWGAMKSFAQLATGAQGGARYVARQLAELAKSPKLIDERPLQFHAVGHSAGSIFHSWFLPTAREEQIPKFETLQLLAPAITNADFRGRLSSQLGQYVTRAVLYTMKKHFEQDDDCIGIYHKSLLYLIYHALEPERRTPVLGLEICIRADADTATLFGLNGATGAPGRVVWSVTDDGDGRSSSRSMHHGDFDDDPLTMNSVAANVLNEPRARKPYIGSDSRSLGTWPVADDWLQGVDVSAVGAGLPLRSGLSTAQIADARPGMGPAPGGAPHRPAPLPSGPMGGPSAPLKSSGSVGTGARRALCVGIDKYPAPNTLGGCVNDTVVWGKVLTAQKFEIVSLTDRQATHANIVAALRKLVTDSKSGDILVFQYSGHGTQVRDEDGDEDDGEDEALVPVDFETGAFLIDDDIRAIFNLLPPGVNLTAFVDCCHSGTITRMIGRNGPDMPEGAQVRFLQRTDQWEDWMRAHARFREHVQQTRAIAVGTRDLVTNNDVRWVNFSACDATEVALEQNGNGDFTMKASPLLVGDLSRYTHRGFQDAVIAAFGERRRQTPQLDCPDSARDSLLLQPIG
jgi:hypothetical protein